MLNVKGRQHNAPSNDLVKWYWKEIISNLGKKKYEYELAEKRDFTSRRLQKHNPATQSVECITVLIV